MRKGLLVFMLAIFLVRQMPYRYFTTGLVGEIQTEQFVICEVKDCPELEKLRPKLKNPLLERGIKILEKGGNI